MRIVGVICGILILAAVLIAAWLVLWNHADVGPVFRTTLRIAWGVWWRCLLIGSLLAICLFRLRIPGRRWWIAILVAWSFMSVSLMTVAWKSAWQTPGGWIDQTTAVLGGFVGPWAAKSDTPTRFADAARQSAIGGEAAVIWVHFCACLPWAVWMLGMAFRGSQGDLEDLLRTENRQWWLRAFSWRWLAVAALLGLWVLTGVMNEIAASDVFYVRTYAEEIYLGFPLGDVPSLNPLRDEPTASFPLLAHLLAIGSTGITLGMIVLLISSDWSRARLRPSRPIAVRGASWLISLVIGVFFGFCLLVPLVELGRQLGTTVRWTSDSAESIWLLQHAVDQFFAAPFRLRVEFGWSLAIVGLATLVTMVISQALCWYSLERPRAWLFIVVLAGLLWSFPAPLLGVYLLQVVDGADWTWVRRAANQSLLLPVISLTLYLLPLSLIVTGLLTRRVPRDLLDAARIESASPLIVWYRTVWRTQRTWQLALVWLLLAFGLNDITATNLVLPAGTDTVARRILGLVHAGVDDQVAATALWSYLASGVLGLAVYVLCVQHDES